MDAMIMVILREIQNECYKQIGIERKGGRAIQEEEMSPYPQKYDYLIDYQNLAELVSAPALEKPKDDPQISIEEAVENAPKNTAENVSDKTATDKDNLEDGAQRYRSKLNAYFSAVRDWHFEKREKAYKYECAKKQADDRTYGFEYIANFIDEYIKHYDATVSRTEPNIL